MRFSDFLAFPRRDTKRRSHSAMRVAVIGFVLSGLVGVSGCSPRGSDNPAGGVPEQGSSGDLVSESATQSRRADDAQGSEAGSELDSAFSDPAARTGTSPNGTSPGNTVSVDPEREDPEREDPARPTDSDRVQADLNPLRTGEGAAATGNDSDSDLDSRQEELFAGWDAPELVIVLTGRQDGYLEPCGCTGLANQKGGVARRATFLEQLRRERGWPVLPVDVGNQVRRYGRQAEIKFQVSADALRKMGYAATTLGFQDLQLSIDELAATSAAIDDAEPLFISANVAVLDPEFTPRFRIIEIGRKRIGITACLGDEARSQIQVDELITRPAAEALAEVWEDLRAADCDYHILLAQATTEETIALARAIPHFQLIVTSGGSDEPSYEPQQIPDTPSLLVNVGAKAMFACAIGVFRDSEQPWRYERIPLDDRFGDDRQMREIMANYQKELERLGLEQLGLAPVAHPSGRHFVGSSVCGDCHTTAYGIWEETPHHHATKSIVDPYERNDVPRHFDPECLSCHVTGWNPQRYFPYESGYLSLTVTPQMTGSGCENCHGPGSAHVAAEMGEVDADRITLASLREQMRLPLAEAEKKCLECHDLDNSPDFHVPGAFQRYWEQIEHWGKD